MGGTDIHPGTHDVSVSAVQERLQLLIDTGLKLGSERDPDAAAQAAVEAGLVLCAAEHGAFVYARFGEMGERLDRVAVAGDPELQDISKPDSASIVAALLGRSALRGSDIRQNPEILSALPLTARPGSGFTARSYLAVPIYARSGESLGALIYVHSEPGVFTQESEKLVTALGSQVAVVIENARLSGTLSREKALADEARAELRRAERRLRLALDAAELGVWSWRSSSGTIDFDERAAELFGVEPHKAYSRREMWQRLIKPEDRGRSPEDLQQLLEEGRGYSAEYRVQQRDGGFRWVCASGVPTLDEHSRRLVGMTGTVQDITLRKKQEESLRQSEKLAATGRLAATIAHEINNPLEAITNLIYLAKTDEGTPESVRQMLETADSELVRVSQIAQQTLGFYRDTTRPVQVDLNELLKAVVDLFQRKLLRKQLGCTMDLEPGLSVVGLQGELRQIISNLLVNAIDASGQGAGEIMIRGRHRRRNGNHGVSVLISDQGAGIPIHLRERLFTPFFTTKQSLGTGLGLWVTRGMVEKHGGSVCYRSCTQKPTGTVFCIHLPRAGAPQLFTPSSAIVQ